MTALASDAAVSFELVANTGIAKRVADRSERRVERVGELPQRVVDLLAFLFAERAPRVELILQVLTQLGEPITDGVPRSLALVHDDLRAFAIEALFPG